jgi:tripartite-type tricarboxylate transporter receptor subunit TctC
MKLPHRRQFLHLAAGAATLPAISRTASAQTYPSRPVHLFVGFPAGGPTDLVARIIGQSLSERLGQQIVVENRPGPGSNIAAEAVIRSPADGYTLLVMTAANAFNATLYDKLSFNFVRDIAPVAGLTRVALVPEVHPSFPAGSVPEFIAYAKANPGKITVASGGNGTPQHVSGELFGMLAGVSFLHVPYRGDAPAITDLVSGQVQACFGILPGSIEHIRAGKLRPLAVTTATRAEALPNIPTVGEFVAGYESSGWAGIGAPKNLPPDIIEKLNQEINAALADPKVKARLADLVAAPLVLSPADFGKLIADETGKWAKVIRTANIKAE